MQTQYSDQLYKRKVHVIGSLSELCTKKSKFKDRPLLIFDDFVGSGKYASEVLDELVSTGIPATNVVIVFHIFERFADGDSLGKIAASLARMKVKSPTGKELWTRETISKILSNEKYDCEAVKATAMKNNWFEDDEIRLLE